MTSGPSDLNGLKVLVVEDNLLLAEVIRDRLEAYGCEVVGPVPDVTQGVAIAREAALDGAVLDINLGGEPCFRSEEHTSELQSLMRISYAVFCLKKKTKRTREI